MRLERFKRLMRWTPVFLIVLAVLIFSPWFVIRRFFGDNIIPEHMEWPIAVYVLSSMILVLILPSIVYVNVQAQLSRLQSCVGRLLSCSSTRQMMHLAAIVIAAIPILLMAQNTIGIGENSHVLDQFNLIRLFDRIFSGDYSWSNIFMDAAFAGHPILLPFLIQLVDAAFFHWNHDLLIYIGLLFGALSALLLANIVNHLKPDVSTWLILPLFSWLIFLPTHVTTYGTPFTAVQVILANLGIVLGLWGAVRFKGSPWAIWIMGLGGVIATWSSGTGVLVWPLLVMVLIAQRDRQVWHYVVLLVIGLLAYLPFSSNHSTLRFLNSPQLQLHSGWVFYHSHDAANVAGMIGVILVLLLFVLSLFSVLADQEHWRVIVPGIAMTLYGIGAILAVAVFRTEMSPWHSSYFIFFWIGILLSGSVLLGTSAEESGKQAGNHLGIVVTVLFPLWSGAAIISATVFMLTHQTSAGAWSDDLIVKLRSPAAASCWQQYQTAPTYCQWLTYFPPPDNEQRWREFAVTLDKLNLADFSPWQRWTLQGDYAMDNVNLEQTDGVPSTIWSRGISEKQRTPWSDSHHLNLMIYPSNQVEWTISIPQEASRAQLQTAVTLGTPRTAGEAVARLQIQELESSPIEVFSENLSSQYMWQDISIPLDQYRGKTIKLIFASSSALSASSNWVVFRYPVIEVDLSDIRDRGGIYNRNTTPFNMDLAPDFPYPTNEDYVFDLSRRIQESEAGAPPPDWWLPNPHVTYLYKFTDLKICAADYTHLVFRAAVPAGFDSGALMLRYLSDNSEWRYFPVPLRNDGLFHRYSLNLRLLDIDRGDNIASLHVWYLGASPGDVIPPTELRLIREMDSQACGS